MNIDLVASVAHKAGFRDTALLVAICVALAESKGQPDAEGDISLQNDKWGPSVGLWQIRTLREPENYYHPDTLRVYDELFDPAKNAEAAYAISKHGTDFSPWSTFIDNKYREYLNDVITYISTHRFE